MFITVTCPTRQDETAVLEALRDHTFGDSDVRLRLKLLPEGWVVLEARTSDPSGSHALAFEVERTLREAGLPVAVAAPP